MVTNSDAIAASNVSTGVSASAQVHTNCLSYPSISITSMLDKIHTFLFLLSQVIML